MLAAGEWTCEVSLGARVMRKMLRSGRAYAVLVPRSCELALCWRASTRSSWLQPT